MNPDFRAFAALAVLTMIASSCMSNRGRSQKASVGTSYNYEDPTDWTENPDPLPIFSPAPSPTPTGGAGSPLISERVEATGYTTTSLTVVTGRKLKLRFRPGIQDKNVEGTGFTPHYSKLGVYIAVGELTQPTPMLRNGFSGGDAQSSHIMDFSQQISDGCDTSDPDCRQEVTITISKPNNDYWCLNWQMYCPYAQMHSTHPWNGTLELETDDTVPLQ
jgi:hypothetical protein